MELLSDLHLKAARERAWLIGNPVWMRQWLLKEAHRASSSRLEFKSDYATRCLRQAKLGVEVARKANFDPSQSRVPAGNPDGGQWTNDEDVNVGVTGTDALSDETFDEFFEPGAVLAQDEPQRRNPINLAEEEARGGHAVSTHVNRRPEALIGQALEAFDKEPRVVDVRSGSFSSLEAANKLVNSTLAENRTTVDLVIRGILARATVISHFGSVTGVEVVVKNVRSVPIFRETYGAGAVVVHDPSSDRGFRVLTAFPTNRRPR
jgi:hypothetical protein